MRSCRHSRCLGTAHTAAPTTHALRAHRQLAACPSLPIPPLSRQVDVQRDAALQLHEEIRTLQSKQGFHHTQLLEFVNSSHHRISEELRGRG